VATTLIRGLLTRVHPHDLPGLTVSGCGSGVEQRWAARDERGADACIDAQLGNLHVHRRISVLVVEAVRQAPLLRPYLDPPIGDPGQLSKRRGRRGRIGADSGLLAVQAACWWGEAGEVGWVAVDEGLGEVG
jgi:hypothetical protein